MRVVRTTRSLLCGLEHSLFNSNDRNKAINTLIARHKKRDLSRDYEVRLVAYVMLKGSRNQKKSLGDQVAEQHPGDCVSITS